MTTSLSLLIPASQDADAERLIAALSAAGTAATWQRVATDEDFLAALQTPRDLVVAAGIPTGFDLLAVLGQVREQSLDLPFIVVSDTLSEDEVVAFLRHGVVEVLRWDALGRLAPVVHRARNDALVRRAKDEAEARYRMISELTSDFSYSLGVEPDDRLRVEWLAGTITTIMGYTPEELMRAGVWTLLIFPPDLEAVRRYFAGLRATPSPDAQVQEARLVARDGEVRWVRLRSRCLWDETGGRPLRIYGAGQDITHSKMAREQLRFQAHLLDTVGQAVIATDLEGAITYWNYSAELLYGWPAVEVLGRAITDIIAIPGQSEVVAIDYATAARLMAGLAHGDGQAGELLLSRRDGSAFTALVTATPIHDEQGNVVGMVGISQDITQRKVVEAALQEAEERYRTLVEHLPTVTYLSTPGASGKLLYLSPQIERILGFPVARWMEDPEFWKTRLHPEDRARVLEDEAQFDDTSTQWHREYRYVARDGRDVWFEEDALLVRDAAGQPLYTMGMMLDVSARRRAEESVRASEQQYRRIVETTHAGIWQVDARSITTFVNTKMAEMLGYTPEEMIGTSLLDYYADPAVRAAVTLRQGQRPANLQEPPSYDVLALRKDGSTLWCHVTGAITLDDAGNYTGVLAMVSDITERKQMEEALQHRALHDALTGLPNRVLLQDRLGQALLAVRRDTTQAALLLLDLDRFKEVNDTFGHHAGDVLLQEVARRLQGALRATDTVARLGGDEFAILLAGTDRAGAVRAADTIRVALEHPVVIGDQAIHVEGSLGIAIAPEHGLDGETLLRCADVAMYAAKGTNQDAAVYTFENDTYTADRLALVGALRQAVSDGALRLHYQPKVDLSTRRVVGVEALVRWAHPQRGLVPPDQFIPLAEHTGLIAPLTLWVLEEALRTHRVWHQQGRVLGVAVNLSTRSLQDPRLPDTVGLLLQRHDVPPAQLTLEITESALMADPARAQEVMMRLVEVGVRISIDDFGTGYSSLAALKQLPVDEVKIDQSFVRGMETPSQKDTAIVRSVIDLGHNLGLRVVAEGVETAAAWERLVAVGCDLAQGYYVSRPMPAAELEAWLDALPHEQDEPREGIARLTR